MFIIFEVMETMRPNYLPARISVSAFFLMHGLFFSTWASRIPSIQQQLKLTDAALGAVLFSLPIGSFITLPLTAWVIPTVSSRVTILVSSVIYGSMLICIGNSHNVISLVLSLFFFGSSGNMINVAFNTQAIAVEALYKRTIISSFHGIWSLAGLAGASIGAFVMGRNIATGIHFIVVALIGFAITALCYTNLLKTDRNPEKKRPWLSRPEKAIVSLGLIAFCSMFCQGAMFDWSGVYFKKVLKVDPALVGTGYAAFMISMTFTRFISDWMTQHLGLKTILQCSGIIASAGLLLAVFFPYLVPATIGFLLIGIAVSPVVPLLFSAVGKSKSMSASSGIAALSTIGFIGLLIGPPLLGFVAGAAGLRISFLLMVVASIAVSILASGTKY